MSINQKMCIIVYTLVILQCSITAVITYHRARKSITLYALMMAQVFIILWLFFGMIENMSSSAEELLFSMRFTLFPASFLGGIWLQFALAYAGVLNKRNRIWSMVIFLPLIITYIPALTTNYFYLTVLYTSIDSPEITQWGIFFLINYIITYMYIIAGSVIIVIKSLKEYQLLQKKIILIIMAQVILITVNTLTIMKVVESPGFDITPIGFAVSFLLISISIFKFNIFNVVQYATVDLFQNTEEAIIILDRDYNIIEFNKNAEQELPDVRLKKGCQIRYVIEVLRARCIDQSMVNDMIARARQGSEIYHTRFQMLDGNGMKQFFDFYLKNIQNDDGEILGSIISFKNITTETTSLIENERNRICGDIHDNLSNMINVVSMNLEYALSNYEDRDEATGCIQTAYDTARGIRINLRRILEELAPIDIEKVGIINALESLFHKVDGTGMRIEFNCSGIDEKEVSTTRQGYVIYKTCMEALNNSFFSGKAKKLDVVLTHREEMIRLFISDDGIGCDIIRKGRGLTVMEERIQSVGGRIFFESVLNEGFYIAAELPF